MTQSRMLLLIVAVLLICTAFIKPGLPDLSGTWVLDREHSKADKLDLTISSIIIDQNGPEIHFEYFRGEQLYGAETFVAGADTRIRYMTRAEWAYTRATFRGNQLVVDTIRSQPNVIAPGMASFVETECWSLTPDRKTLIHRLADGKVVMYSARGDVVLPTSEWLWRTLNSGGKDARPVEAPADRDSADRDARSGYTGPRR